MMFYKLGFKVWYNYTKKQKLAQQRKRQFEKRRSAKSTINVLDSI